MSGKYEPPFTVASLATITHSRPSTTPMPVTIPALGAPPSYSSQAASAFSSRKAVPGSTSRSTRSRAGSLPRERCRSVAFSPPPRATCAVRSRSSATSSAIRSCRSANSPASRSSCEVRTATRWSLTGASARQAIDRAVTNRRESPERGPRRQRRDSMDGEATAAVDVGTSEDARLESLGYKPQLNRVLGFFSNFAVGVHVPVADGRDLLALRPRLRDRRAGVHLADLHPADRDALRRARLRRAREPLSRGRGALPIQQVLGRPAASAGSSGGSTASRCSSRSRRSTPASSATSPRCSTTGSGLEPRTPRATGRSWSSR